jgi:type IV pilus assembly protein PilE
MRDDPCGVFTLDATGQRGNRNGANGVTPASGECWNTG